MDDFRMAYAVLCHKNPEQINILIDAISDTDADIFIHVDKKAKFINKINKKNNLYFVDKRFNVSWGGSSIVYATIELLKKINETGDYKYIHLISGQDLPLKSNSKIKEFYRENYGKQFMVYKSLPNHWQYHGMNRVLVYYPQCILHNKITRKIIRILDMIVMNIKFLQRDISSLPKLYGGSEWFSITGDCMRYILKYVENNCNYMKFFKNSLCSDEIFFQTIVANSQYKQYIINDNLRYTDWIENSASPKVLTMDYYEKLKSTDRLFGRKFDIGIDKEIIFKLLKLNSEIE